MVLGITLGTGLGCGIVVRSRIYRGQSGNAGEVAYCPIDRGCFDERLSGSGVQYLYTKISGQPAPSPKEIGDLAVSGDEVARKTWKAYGETLGRALSVILAVLDPSICLIGGGIARRFPLFRAALENTLHDHLCPVVASRLQLVQSQLDDAAGVTGAAEHALQEAAGRGTAPNSPCRF